MINIHATLVCYQGKGILIRGKSGSGKSDMALRLIMDKQALLIADDRVNLYTEDNMIFGSVPDEIKGKMEIRGLGIAELPYELSCPICLVVDLVDKNEVERMPFEEKECFLGIDIPKIKLFAFEYSATCKIIAKICGFIR